MLKLYFVSYVTTALERPRTRLFQSRQVEIMTFGGHRVVCRKLLTCATAMTDGI